MIATVETGSPHVIGLKLTAKLHDEDYTVFARAMEAVLSAEGKVRLFVQYDDFPGWDLYAAWEDFTLSVTHHCDFERVAIVGDRKCEDWMADFCKPFTNATVKCFGKSETDAAWKWLKEDEKVGRENRELGISEELDLYTWSGL